MNLAVTPLYAALLALVFMVLSVRAVRARTRSAVLVGDGGDEGLLRAMRAHGNFAEYVPLALILLLLQELQGAAAWRLHALGAALLAGRIIHAYGVSQLQEKLTFRIAGMVLTMGMLTVSTLTLLLGALMRG